MPRTQSKKQMLMKRILGKRGRPEDLGPDETQLRRIDPFLYHNVKQLKSVSHLDED